MYDFDIITPTTVTEAVDALKEEEAQPLAGGQTLIPTLKARLASPSALVRLGQIDALQKVTEAEGTITIGAAVTHARVAREATSFPALAALASQIGDPAVRNRGTIGGSLANNDPAACYPAAGLGSGATVLTDRREIAADAFFDGLFTTTLAEGEIVTGVRFPIPDTAAYVKFVQPASRFAMVGVFVSKIGNDVRVAVTGASEDGVFRWSDAEKALSSSFTPDALEGLAVDPEGLIADIHATKDYRAHMVNVMTQRAVKAAS